MSSVVRSRSVLRLGAMAILVEPRTVIVGATLAAVGATLGLCALMLGDYSMSALDTVRALFGVGTDPLAQFFVQSQRAPRVVAALLVGAALGVSGGIFQSLSGNALGSPDIIGFTTGAASGALVQIIVFGAGPAATAAGAVIGGFGTATVVYLLAWRGGLTGYRLVLVGIGTGLTLQALNTLLVVRASLTAAQSAAQWLAGSFNATTWSEVVMVLVACVILIPAALLLARPLAVMAFGDALAIGLGVRVERTRLLLVVVGIALVSLATATAGPIAFVALAAPQLARRLTRTNKIGLGVSALMGAVLVLVSDVIAQRLFAPTQPAVGGVTGAIGGLYLIWILIREGRRSRL